MGWVCEASLRKQNVCVAASRVDLVHSEPRDGGGTTFIWDARTLCSDVCP